MFIQAQHEYLKGDWEQSEWLLTDRLERHPRDVEARLLLATIFRRTGRWDKASHQLEMLRKLDDSAAWSEEIEQEREFIEQGMLDDESVTEDETDIDETDTPVTTMSAPIRLGQFSQVEAAAATTIDENENTSSRRPAA